MTDPIADMLTRIRNAITANKETVEIPASNEKKAIAEILVEEGWAKEMKIVKVGYQRFTKSVEAWLAQLCRREQYAPCTRWIRNGNPFHEQGHYDGQESKGSQRRWRSSLLRLVREVAQYVENR